MKKNAGKSECIIPFLNTARKYGYIMWKKMYDKEILSFIGEKQSINLLIDGKLQKEKNIDWKRRRIGITYSLTRKIPLSMKKIKMKRKDIDTIIVTFQ